MGVRDIVFIIALVLLSSVAWMFIQAWIIKRTIPKVIRIFEQKDAIGIRNAKTVEELGLRQKSFLEGMLSRRDYKPKVLEFLMRTNIVQTTEDGKLYITQQTLDSVAISKLRK